MQKLRKLFMVVQPNTELSNRFQALSRWAEIGLSKGAIAVGEFVGLKAFVSNPIGSLIELDDLGISSHEDSVNSQPSICLLQSIDGTIKGFFLFSVPTELLTTLTNCAKQKMSNEAYLPEFLLSQSLIGEWANIFAGNIISVIESADIKAIRVAPIEQAYDMSGAALDFIACQMGLQTDLLAVYKCFVLFEGISSKVHTWIILNPSSSPTYTQQAI